MNIHKFSKIAFLLGVLNFSGCCNGDVQEFFNIEGITAINAIQSSSGLERKTAAAITTAVNEYRIIVEPVVTYYGSNFNMNWLPSFTNSAYACSYADEGYNGTEEKLTLLTVTSSELFDSAGTISDTLNRYFEVYGSYTSEDDESNDFGPVDIGSFINNNRMAPFKLRLKLKAAPTGSLKHTFTVVYTLNNGEQYAARTNEVVFTP